MCSLVVLDRSQPLTGDDRRAARRDVVAPRVIVANKADLAAGVGSRRRTTECDRVSALTGEGIDDLRAALAGRRASATTLRDTPAITNLRHVGAARARARARSGARGGRGGAGEPEEFVLADVHEARRARGDHRTRTPDDVLQAIFREFCIGK